MKKLIVLITVVFAAMAFGEGIVLLPLATANVDSATTAFVDSVMRANLKSMGYEVFPGDTVCREIACAGEIARRRHTPLALFGSLLGMGDQLVLTVYLVRSDDEIEGKERLSVAKNGKINNVVKKILVDLFPQRANASQKSSTEKSN